MGLFDHLSGGNDRKILDMLKSIADTQRNQGTAIGTALQNFSGVVVELARNIKTLTERIETMAQTNAELVQLLNNQKALIVGVTEGMGGLKTVVTKVGTETDGLKEAIVKLQEALNNQGNVPPEVEAAMAEVTAASGGLQTAFTDLGNALKVVDDKVTDAPEIPPVEGGGQPN